MAGGHGLSLRCGAGPSSPSAGEGALPWDARLGPVRAACRDPPQQSAAGAGGPCVLAGGRGGLLPVLNFFFFFFFSV